jgi:hypothetical protein
MRLTTLGKYPLLLLAKQFTFLNEKYLRPLLTGVNTRWLRRNACGGVKLRAALEASMVLETAQSHSRLCLGCCSLSQIPYIA